jgi:hypothetical protein
MTNVGRVIRESRYIAQNLVRDFDYVEHVLLESLDAEMRELLVNRVSNWSIPGRHPRSIATS